MSTIQKKPFAWGTLVTILGFVLCIAGLLALFVWFDARVKKTAALADERMTVMAQQITDLQTIILATQTENSTLSEALVEAKKKSENLSKAFERVADNVETLEKITTTDPELLQKYSNVYFLNEHYAPLDLKTIPKTYTYQSREMEIHAQVWPFLKDLLDEAEKDEMSLQIISAFRSFGEQAQLKGVYTVTYGAGSANQFSADQGYSEHQLGTTIDFTNPTVGSSFTGFAKSKEYAWLQENAYRFGFVLSYPENNDYYQFEPWHWRFVGVELATYLHKKEKHFYDLSQREIDAYIATLFE